MKPTTLPAPLDTESLRQDFPILSTNAASGLPLVYLDNAASTQRPNRVIDAMSDCYRRYYSNVHRGIHTLSEESTRRYEQARDTVSRFINASSSREIIFTSGTTASINTVARSWGDAFVQRDDVILLLISEHHANIVPWHQLAARVGCRVEFVPIDDDFLITDEVMEENLRRLRPKLLSFGSASNTLGTEYPLLAGQRWLTRSVQKFSWMQPNPRRTCRSTSQNGIVIFSSSAVIKSVVQAGLVSCMVENRC